MNCINFYYKIGTSNNRCRLSCFDEIESVEEFADFDFVD